MKIKNIIQRNLDLSNTYTLIDKKYIPVIDGGGACCANCNKLIANIATVSDKNNNVFNIGLDCLETLMLNNQILKGVKIDFEAVKKAIPRVKRALNDVSEFLNNNSHLSIDTVEVEKCGDWISYYYFKNGKTIYNTSIKIKSLDVEIYKASLTAKFKNININYKF
jgi:hypothetical protein